MPIGPQWVVVCDPTATTSSVTAGALTVTCKTADGVVGRPQLVKAYLSEQPSPFEMTAEDGAVASGLIVSCWITAFAVRSVISIFRGSTKNDS